MANHPNRNTIKIYVEGRHASGSVTSIRAAKTNSHISITRRQYEAAARRLHLVDGDGLRLAPVGNHDATRSGVVVYDGTRTWGMLS